MVKKNKISIFIFIVVIFCILLIFTSLIVKRHVEISAINSILCSTNDTISLLEYLQEKNYEDEYLETKLKSMVISDVMSLSLVQPDIDDLQGTPINALYRVIKYNNQYGLTMKNSERITKLAKLFTPYLKSIEEDVIQEYNEIEQAKRKLKSIQNMASEEFEDLKKKVNSELKE